MYEYIECRRCDSPNCFGCNNATLIEMFHKGKFDCLLDEHNTINPAADVEVVKHGRWVNWQPKIALAEYSYDTKACSKCGYAMANALRIPAYYCPNCGCKMDLEVTNGLD